MFWQIYQKLMLSGFLNSGNLCLIHHLKKFWPHTASTASVKKSAIYQWKIGFLAIHSTKNDQYWLFWCQWWSDNQDQTFSWENWPLEAVEAAEAAKAAEVHEDEEVSNAWKITTEDFRGFQILEFNNLRTLFWCFEKKNLLPESSKLMLNFSTFSVGGRWGCVRSKKFQMMDQA